MNLYLTSVFCNKAKNSSEIRECLLTFKTQDNYTSINTLTIITPYLRELNSGVFFDFKFFKIEITARNLSIIEPDILDRQSNDVREALQCLIIRSDLLEVLNEQQFSGFRNVWGIEITGTRLTSLDMGFTFDSNLRVLKLMNAGSIKTIGRVQANIMGEYHFENTSLESLPTKMFEYNFITEQHVVFKNNHNLKKLQTNVFQGGYDALKIFFEKTPIEIIEPYFVDSQKTLFQIQLGGNKLGYINQTVFKPILEDWHNRNLSNSWIKWDIDIAGIDEATSDRISCDCELAWLTANPPMAKFVKNAVCVTGETLEEFVGSGIDMCYDCPSSEGLYPHPSDCTKFYQCSDNKAFLQSCPENLVYNEFEEYCDWPYNVAPPCGTNTTIYTSTYGPQTMLA
ncbi:uncharacterized protein LOC136028558 isoform X2 [Artemia franciscana]|uniref:Chitin-binding type-2 domain-containing protein n=1 Tax=Artemia franciscana TaxID=6661 RepID=A0AA88IG00_ARTSF|nr:hypothetical protein QYM36_008216 [Artemia franciscana]